MLREVLPCFSARLMLDPSWLQSRIPKPFRMTQPKNVRDAQEWKLPAVSSASVIGFYKVAACIIPVPRLYSSLFGAFFGEKKVDLCIDLSKSKTYECFTKQLIFQSNYHPWRRFFATILNLRQGFLLLTQKREYEDGPSPHFLLVPREILQICQETVWFFQSRASLFFHPTSRCLLGRTACPPRRTRTSGSQTML